MEWITGATPSDFSLDLVIFHRSLVIFAKYVFEEDQLSFLQLFSPF